MAIPTTFEIDFACGHTEERDLSKKPAGKRKSIAKWLETKDCSACSKEEKAAEYKKKLYEDALANQKKLGLPELEGTEKQLPWATTARDTLIMAAHEEFVMGENPVMDEADFEQNILVPARLITSSRWWIDYRDTELEDLKECLDTALDDESAEISENPF